MVSASATITRLELKAARVAMPVKSRLGHRSILPVSLKFCLTIPFFLPATRQLMASRPLVSWLFISCDYGIRCVGICHGFNWYIGCSGWPSWGYATDFLNPLEKLHLEDKTNIGFWCPKIIPNVKNQKFGIPNQQLMGLHQEATPSLQSSAMTCVGKAWGGRPIQ